jgi:putative endonuclease
MSFYVYILQFVDGTYYTGYTKDLDERTRQHESGKGAKYTKSHRPQRVAYVELFGTRSAAMKRERQIKKLSHQQKLVLIVSQGKGQPSKIK